MERMMKWCYERWLDTGREYWLGQAHKYAERCDCPCDGCQSVVRRVRQSVIRQSRIVA
jgi:hypothetical protein